MARNFIIKGDTIEKKFKYLETILPRIFKRLNKYVISVTPPSVIHFFKESLMVGSLWKFMMISSRLIKISILIENFPEDTEVDLSFSVSNESGSQSVKIKMTDNMLVRNLDLRLSDGDVFELSLENTTAEISNIFVTLVCVVQGGKNYIEKHLIDAIDRENADEVAKLLIR